MTTIITLISMFMGIFVILLILAAIIFVLKLLFGSIGFLFSFIVGNFIKFCFYIFAIVVILQLIGC